MSFALSIFKRLILSLLLVCFVLPPVSASGTRRLQPATFQTYSSGGGAVGIGGSQTLQPSTGLHLTDGYDRRPGTNPTAYNPGEPSLNMGLVRWEPKKMPLKVWISPGLALPDLPFTELQKVRPDQVYQILCTPTDPAVNPTGDPFMGLPQANSWTPETNAQVEAGISQWKQFESEGLFSFTFTNDPREAQILVFFVDAFRDSTSPGGIMVGGNTCAQVYPLEQAMRVNIQQKPVIIELSTLVNETPEKMIGATAHEFGHALGIKAHSPYRDDIMHENRVVTQLSAADKATIRKLYHSKPAYVM
ncbi:MAG: matrixin family metalloprotease [Cyanobacteria bacterium SZAS LIN-3]|nr:matrixin family metalloprotease [Cyanobacteria bacterium SZAS LIN-3]